MKIKAFVVGVALSTFSCGNGDNNSNSNANGMTNNGMTNNGMTNNGMTNAGTTNADTTNNGMTNNGMTNNGMTNSMTNNTHGLMGDCYLYEADTNDDGMANQAQLVQLDDAGNEAMVWFDQDADGMFDVVIENSFDAEGRIIEQVVDFGNDGTTDLHIYVEYDAAGNETSVRWDAGDDGTDDFVMLQTYDSDGQRTGLTRDGALNPARNGIAEMADGTVDYVFTGSWYDVGKPALFEWDTDGDGTADAVSTWTYDMATGELIEFTMDGNVDPRATQPNGQPMPDQPLLEAADGEIDFRVFDIVTNADGFVVEQKTDGRINAVTGAFSQQPDGTGDLRMFEVDAEGRVTLAQVDEGNDGTVDVTIAFTYDADGNMTERTIDGVVNNDQIIQEVQDGTVNERTVQTWSESGITSYARDFDDDGTDEVTMFWEYDADGNVTHFEADGNTPFNAFELQTPADGTPDTLVDQEFDTMGRQTLFYRELQGAFDVRVTWAYDSCSALQ